MEEGDAATARWLLATRYPADFGQRARHEISGVDGGPIETSNVGGILIQAIPEDDAGAEPKALPPGATTFLILPPKDPEEGTPEAIALDERRARARASEAAPLRRRALDEPDDTQDLTALGVSPRGEVLPRSLALFLRRREPLA
jgi:hypothetical protein